MKRIANDPALDFIMEAGWAGCVRWASNDAQVIARFESETGHKFRRATPIEALVDKAAGYHDDVLAAFVEWVTVELWGEESAPAKYREELARRRATR